MSVVHLAFSISFFLLTTSSIGGIFLNYLDKTIKIKNNESLINSFPIRFFLGQTILAFVWFSICNFYYSPTNTHILVIFSFICLLFDFSLFRKFKVKLPKISVESGIWVGVLILFFFAYCFLSLSGSKEWDDMAYHQPVVEEISKGMITFPLLSKSPYIDFYKPFSVFYGSLSFNFETTASILYSLSGNHPASAALLAVINLFIFFLFLCEFLPNRYHGNLENVLVICIMICTNYGISILLGTGLIDISAAIYQLLALIFLLLGIESSSKKYYYLSVIFLASAVGHKFTSLYLLPFYLIFSAYYLYKNKIITSDIIFIISASTLSGLFWYIKNVILHNNPVYPLYFGHSGMSDIEYSFLMDSLINGIRITPSLENIFYLIKTSYGPEPSTQVSFFLVSIYIFTQHRKIFFEVSMYIAALLFVGLNYGIGSQLSRYMIVAPLIFHILLYPVFSMVKRLRFFVIIYLIVVLCSSVLQQSYFKNKIAIIESVIFQEKNTSSLCFDTMIKYLDKENVAEESVLNFWDPYTSVVYENTKYFYNFHGNLDLDSFVLPSSIKYVYTNSTQKNTTLIQEWLHRDIEPHKRKKIEDFLINDASIVYEQDVCTLYKLNDNEKK